MNLGPLLADASLAFRGYNVTNLGRSHELLSHPHYGAVVAMHLREGSEICSDVTGRDVDLVSRVQQQRETELDDYAEAITLIVVMEQAQLCLLSKFHAVDYRQARLMLGFSLGEISALVAGGSFTLRDALQVPLAMAEDCVALARDTTMGIVFSRGDAIPMDRVAEVCLEINARGNGIIGVSTLISPNSFLILGTQDTVKSFRRRLPDIMSSRLYLRLNDHHWPPLHTPIMWQRNIPNRASIKLLTLPGGRSQPHPSVMSMVTGAASYDALNSRELIGQWIDHPQRLWDVINHLLVTGVETVIHVGPQPNIIPATFDRIAANVEAQTRGSRRLRAASVAVRRPWLQAILPRRAALLRAPLIRHIILEDWLLEFDPQRDEPS